MKSYKTILGLQKSIDKAKKSGHKIAFIPTMGALHSGHLSLVKVAQNYADTVIVSIFVNPKQFNDQSDLDNKLPLKLIIGPTLREIDGLAMSSRNVRLTPEMRHIAPAIYKTLNKAKTMLGLESIDHIVTTCKVELDKLGFQTEYLEIVDGNTLKPIENPANHDYIVACVATWAGKVRLIDNLILKGELQMN